MADEPLASDDESTADESQEIDEEAIRQAALEESIRKMRELERDRPIWEEAAKKREAQEAQEQARQEALRREKQARAEAEAIQRGEVTITLTDAVSWVKNRQLS